MKPGDLVVCINDCDFITGIDENKGNYTSGKIHVGMHATVIELGEHFTLFGRNPDHDRWVLLLSEYGELGEVIIDAIEPI